MAPAVPETEARARVTVLGFLPALTTVESDMETDLLEELVSSKQNIN